MVRGHASLAHRAQSKLVLAASGEVLQLFDPAPQVLRHRYLSSLSILKRDNGSLPFGSNGLQAMADKEVIHRAAVRSHGRNPCAHGDGVGIRERLTVARLRGRQDGA